ncbi:hypothetical protein FH972_000728 [Carpinus fangiana]|uniref:Uncharacterized protein n=1 Tax=Carpinus fangiana TaxID=176857 RepID=A0A5N6Q9R3_9ROSI|nr:hypothetical protein FH972_000728 [Carpinus fangiana]
MQPGLSILKGQVNSATPPPNLIKEEIVMVRWRFVLLTTATTSSRTRQYPSHLVSPNFVGIAFAASQVLTLSQIWPIIIPHVSDLSIPTTVPFLSAPSSASFSQPFSGLVGGGVAPAGGNINYKRQRKKDGGGSRDGQPHMVWYLRK